MSFKEKINATDEELRRINECMKNEEFRNELEKYAKSLKDQNKLKDQELLIQKLESQVNLSKTEYSKKEKSSKTIKKEKKTQKKNNPKKKKLIEEIVSKPTTPKYEIIHSGKFKFGDYLKNPIDKVKRNIPDSLKIIIYLPLLSTIKNLNLEIHKDYLELSHEKYILKLIFPYQVNDDNGIAKFVKKDRRLVLNLPVIYEEYDKNLINENTNSGGINVAKNGEVEQISPKIKKDDGKVLKKEEENKDTDGDKINGIEKVDGKILKKEEENKDTDGDKINGIKKDVKLLKEVKTTDKVNDNYNSKEISKDQKYAKPPNEIVKEIVKERNISPEKIISESGSDKQINQIDKSENCEIGIKTNENSVSRESKVIENVNVVENNKLNDKELTEKNKGEESNVVNIGKKNTKKEEEEDTPTSYEMRYFSFKFKNKYLYEID